MNEKHEQALYIDAIRNKMLQDIIEHNKRIMAQNEAFIESRQAKFDFVDGILDIARIFILFS